MKKRKILYVVTKSVWGGAQRYVYDLATNLPKERYEIVVAAGGNGLLFDKLREVGVKTISIAGLERDIHSMKEFKVLWQLYQIFKSEKPDVIHLNSSKIGAVGSLAAFFHNALKAKSYKLKAKVIFTIHGWGFYEKRNRISRTAIFLASWITSLFCDRVILINRKDYDAAQKFIPQRKLALIYNGVYATPCLPRISAQSLLAEKTGVDVNEKDIVIGTVAEYTKNKGLEYLIEAIKQCHSFYKLQAASCKLVVYCIGSGEDEKKLNPKIHATGLSGHIVLTGFIPDAQRLMSAFDIFALPSIKEGLPYTILEAMAAGLPIIATRVGGIPNIIEEGKTGILVPPQNPHGLARAIHELAKNKNLRETLGQAARRRVIHSFSLASMLQKTMQLYENLCSK